MNQLGSDLMQPIELPGLGMAAYFAAGIVAAFAGTAYPVKRYGWPPLPAELRALAPAFARKKRPGFDIDGDEPIAFQGRLKHRFTPWLDGRAEGWSRAQKLITPDSGSWIRMARESRPPRPGFAVDLIGSASLALIAVAVFGGSGAERP